LDIANAQQVLDEDHYGLASVKDRVLDHIAVRKLAAEKMQTPILCFLGPPGTGKTSLGKSIARALGREFVRVSLGGVRDEAEIRGHRRTYIGAMPGRIIQTMKRAGTVNPVLMLDEIDKLGMDFHGDPAAALLEVLDPEQNSDFQDHYMDMPYDLSQVLFITTANDLYPLPPALEDRLEIIEFPGYIEEDKLAIAQNYLIPKQLESHGLDDSGVKFEIGTLQTLVREYTYEAGVRSLNRRIAEVMRKIARQSAEGKKYPKRVRATMLDEMIGPPDYTLLRANDEDQVGVVTGMAWTSGGGDVMTIEVSLLPGKGSLTLTGQLGDVMQESAQAALSFMRRHADRLDVPHDDFEDFDLHIHLPEGAVPKDGPSAGITLAIAIISVFTEQKVRSNYAMTGEITLRGKVLPVGGIREKIMAARRAQITNIIIPEVNQRDLVEIPKQALRNLNIVPVSDMQQVMDLVLHDPPPEGRARDAESDDNSSSDDENDE
ncbi:MAG: endopeptidase La, partial [Chloroflexota bacterium]